MILALREARHNRSDCRGYPFRLQSGVCVARNLGFDKIRINPGNIGGEERVRSGCRMPAARGNIPIRIGVNGGSLEKHILAKYGAPTPEALCESALYHASLLEKFDFHNIVLSIKTSTVHDMIEANRRLASLCPYPLHLGVTEAGGGERGLLKGRDRNRLAPVGRHRGHRAGVADR